MASFTALNIIPDEHSDDEVDNTKELQIEEALKLYQAALKLHAQGPSSYPLAVEAYTNLFKSEIFSYPESITAFARIEANPELGLLDPSFPLELDLTSGEPDGGPSTLPQILYLAYKNHGQFILDCLKSRLQQTALPPDLRMDKQGLDYQGKAAIENFALALAKDSSDTELWRRASRIGAMLGSKRIARYCLEAAVEMDDDPTISEVEPMSLEEGFAGEQLKEALRSLSDEMALSHPIMVPYTKKTMPSFLKKHIDPYSFLPDHPDTPGTQTPETEGIEVTQARIVLNVADWSWTALGDALTMLAVSPQGLSGAGVVLRFLQSGPAAQSAIPDHIAVEDQIMKDAGLTESPIADVASPIPAEIDDRPVEIITTTTTVPLSDVRGRSQSITLPSRKRSQSAAGIRDTPDEDSSTQKRSKRIRNRDNTSEVDPATQFEEQLKPFTLADQSLFAYVGDLLQRIDVDDLGTLPELQSVLANDSDADTDDRVANTALRDLQQILQNWDDGKASVFVNANVGDLLGSAGGSSAGLAAFLEHSKFTPLKLATKPMFDISEGLEEFVRGVESAWMPLQDISYDWLCTILQTYRSQLWPDDLKVSVVRVISYVDPDLYVRFRLEVARLQAEVRSNLQLEKLYEMVETLFELHSDIYTRITNPGSQVHYETRIMTKERLDRWAGFTADVVRARDGESMDDLTLRYLWTSTYHATLFDDISREHKILCWSDLKQILEDAGKEPLELQNNAVITEISAAAAEREVSRLTSMDFIYNLFKTDTSDPNYSMAIINTLEPVLDPEGAYEKAPAEEISNTSEVADNTPASLRDMSKFLTTGGTSLRLYLWERLREAYFSLQDNSKVFSCYLKSIEIIVQALRSKDFVDIAAEARQHQLLLWLKALDDLLVKALSMALNDAATCFDIIDDRHLKATSASIAQLNRLLHTAAIFDDQLRVGMIPASQNTAYGPNGSFGVFGNKLREMQVRTWALQYTMVKEAIAQDIKRFDITQLPKVFPDPAKDLADYLAVVHYSLGLRKCCRVSNKIFLKMMKVEMIRLKQVDKWEDYLGQVLYDLYGIRLGVGTYLLEEHGCPTETLDRRTVLNIADQVIVLANRMPMKDLLKHELRSTIERMQTAIGPAKATPQMAHNLRNLTEFIRNSIRPLHLYQALKGQIQIDSIPVVTADSGLADNGWYFLQGMIALTKFRSQKRLGPGGQTDDMRVSATFMRLQLQYSAENWEAWYRLAQCFDYELEDEVMWSADKINSHPQELIRLQRGAIHCYVMAISTAVRIADSSFETAAKLSELYCEFGMRIYASSRDPFQMKAFWVDGFEKHMSGIQGMYKRPLHEELSRYKAWKYAAALFRRSLADRPNYWVNHYMIGKCLWKMFQYIGDEWDPKAREKRPTIEAIINAFLNAIKTAPKQKDPRQEQILEPHYKLVSIVHKLVTHNHMEIQAAADLLQQQPWAIRKGEAIVMNNFGDWKKFVLDSLRYLRNADKSHWHHRMVARTAAVLYDMDHPDQNSAHAARVEFRESIFTKTMHVQVWKTESERPGRHCVYMSKYVRTMVSILWAISDKANMEQLAKRIRKKGTEYYKFSDIWAELCTYYLRMIRNIAQVPPSIDEVFKGVPTEEFEIFSDRLGLWIADPDMRHPALDALREAIELKKLNANQMKATPIDDLINDCWAQLYIQVARGLPGPEPSSLQRAQLDGTTDVHSPRPTGPMSLNNLVMNMDGTQIPVPFTVAGSEPIRPRKIGVGRREVLRRAEAAINRAPEAPRALAPHPRPSEPSSLVLGSNAPPNGSSSSVPRVEVPVRRLSEKRNGDEAEREESSAPGSLHDSADDESDLSDVPDIDDVEGAMIFPNLMKRDAAADSSRSRGGSGDGASTPAKDA